MKRSTATALFEIVCWLNFACALERSYILNVGMFYYSNPLFELLDGSLCRRFYGRACGVVFRIAAAPCPTCMTQESWYPNASETYNDSRLLEPGSFGSKQLSMQVTLKTPLTVNVFFTAWIETGRRSFVLMNESHSLNFSSRTNKMADKIIISFGPNSRRVETALEYAIECDSNTCGETCVRTNEKVGCFNDAPVCSNEVHEECELLRGNFEYRVHLTHPELTSTSTNTALGQFCPEKAYVCFDDKCDESEPLGSTSHVQPNSSTVAQNVVPFYIAQVNLTKKSVRVHVLVVQSCSNASRVKHFVGQLAVPSTVEFELKNSSFAGVVVDLGCPAGFTGPTCAQPCADCFVGEQGLCSNSNRSSAYCAHARLCRSEQPCWNGGTCAIIERARNNTMLKFGRLKDFAVQCECKQGYSGQFCEIVNGETCLNKKCSPMEYCVETYLGPVHGLKAKCECLSSYSKESCRLCSYYLHHPGSTLKGLENVCNHNQTTDYRFFRINSSIPASKLGIACGSRYSCTIQISLCVNNNCRLYKKNMHQRTFKFEGALMIARSYSMHLDLRYLVVPKCTSKEKSVKKPKAVSYYWMKDIRSFVEKLFAANTTDVRMNIL